MAHRQVINRDSWQQILASAVSIFDDLKSRKLDLPYLVLGGGTVLMFRFEHRLSRDIDFFMRDVQWLGFITPRLNDVVAAMVEGYEEHANSLKLILPAGDIDFVAAGTVTSSEPIEMLRFQDYSFPLETTEEILAKKLFYRPESFKPRDVFDLAIAIDPGERPHHRSPHRLGGTPLAAQRDLEGRTDRHWPHHHDRRPVGAAQADRRSRNFHAHLWRRCICRSIVSCPITAAGKLVTVTAVPAPGRFGGIAFDGDRITRFAEKNAGGDGWINGGFMVMEPDVLDYLRGDGDSLEISLLERLSRDGQLAACKHSGLAMHGHDAG